MQQTLSQFPYFEVLKSQDIDWIVSKSTVEDCAPGTVLIQQGSPVDSIYLSLSGTLAVMVSGEQQAEQELKQMHGGEMMGEMSFLDNHPPSATIKVVEPSQVLSIPKQKLAQKLENDGDFAARFYQVLAVKLSGQLRGLSDLLTQTEATAASQPLRKVLLVFSILTDRDISWVISNGISQKVGPGTTLIEQGKRVPAVYILLEGNLGIYISLSDNGRNREKQVANSFKGEILGEMSFVETGMASATVKAAENSWVLGIDRAQLAAKLEYDRSFAARFYRAIAIVLSNRWRDRLFRRGFSTLESEQSDVLSEDIEAEDELDLDVIDGTALAGTRFDWMIRQLR
ncbi:cyclic nucleotide-binding domain-containing protein [Roseofilum casamattae]|uniref:Cyclic nucleotide-binding domain-containing protein n=1 Tax=Roseofilum casamattae BLCC-M143 TaxID=3022442 RepID=A0ABT7BYT3_9CYAN|nr:cyclic nucleotide-binding domain-containing protein [Roseofilum casamattae]MDJ1184361.1 cyclic nucleotide-binding domain-containing protein [Roseofilum casamattae BLCC-M143]